MSLSVIHFSDIHIKDERDVIFTRIDKLKAACVSSLPTEGDVVIVVSGDIAFSGEQEQYYLAMKMFEEISQYIKQEKRSKVRILCVPGNHDCDFDLKSLHMRDVLIESAKPSNIDCEYYNQVKKVQHMYDDFSRTYGINSEKCLPTVELIVGENKVLFLLGNTSWMSVIEEEPGKIIMPTHLFPTIRAEEYKIIFYVCHHPNNWMNPNFKRDYIDYVRSSADIILVGHEHERDNYKEEGSAFSVFCNHGKELQETNGKCSAFSVLNFDSVAQNFDLVDFVWSDGLYKRTLQKKYQYHKNISTTQNVYHPNEMTVAAVNDIGITVNHFAKDDVTLSDLFIWPNLNKSDYHNEKRGNKVLRSKIAEELSDNALNIIVGASAVGKTALAKYLFLIEEPKETSCVLLSGKDFTSSDINKIQETIEKRFAEQYNIDSLEEFNQLPRNKRIAIIDDFDLIKYAKDRRIKVLDYLCSFFGRVTILMSSSIELTTILTSEYVSSLEQLIYYEILPLGNTKRKELISKWYRLNESNLTEEEIVGKIEKAMLQINTFLGNGAGFIPAVPVFIIGTLQNSDAFTQTLKRSKYGFLYESLIGSCLSKVSPDYQEAGTYDIDQGVLSKLSFEMLKSGKTSFTVDQLSKAVSEIGETYFLDLSSDEFLTRMQEANLVQLSGCEGAAYRFKYPYIFYYFSGRYIAYNLNDPEVISMVEKMSAKLYNETYGNVIVFVCHFAGSSEIIDRILLNAYGILDNYEAFDFQKSNPIFEEIKEAVDALIPETVVNDANVEENKNKVLIRLDEAGINDGRVTDGEMIIADELSEKEKEMASVSAALKTIEVLGQILQNYPIAVKGKNKIEIINEMHNLGMRSIQAIINAMGYIEKELIESVAERAAKAKKSLRREDIAKVTRKFINMLISSMARGMVHQVAISLNSDHLLRATQKTFEADPSISSKLILADLKMNCINSFSYNEIHMLKKSFDDSNEIFASRILDSIIGHYLNFTRCDQGLRSRLCSLCGFSEQQAIIAQQKNLLN